MDAPEVPNPTTEPDPVGPLPLRMGLFTAIVVGIVVVALAGSALYNRFADEPSPSDSATPTEAGSNAPALEKAPNFTIDLLDGTTFDLEQHLAEDGRPVILNFWASWCVPCRAEMPDFDVIAQEKPGLRIVGVAVSDTVDNATAFADEIGVSYGLGIDETEVVAASYPFLGLPSTWFIDENGLIVREFAGQVTAETLREFIAGDFGI